MHRINKKYKEEVAPKLAKEFNIDNVNAIPKLEKIVINVGLGKGLNEKDYADFVEGTLVKITGQKPVRTKAKKSISNFKIRIGQVVGIKLTLRKDKMYDFFDKLVNITFPRVRDFRGIDKRIIDKSGNATVGIKEHICFPEIKLDELEKIHGLEITIVTTAKNKAQGEELLKELGFPFIK